MELLPADLINLGMAILLGGMIGAGRDFRDKFVSAMLQDKNIEESVY